MPQFITTTFDRLAEADVRHSCGPRVFAQADQLERTGHIMQAGASEDYALVGQVRGTWRRVEDVKIGASGARLTPACTCGTGGFCRHVGALLLHWVRHPRDFAPGSPADDGPPRFARTGTETLQEIGGLVSNRALTLKEELTGLLEGLTTARLREIAQVRGISYPKSRGKADVVAHLATAFASPESVDAALAQLDDDALLALDVVQLSGAAVSYDADAYDDFDDEDDDDDDFFDRDDLLGDMYSSLGGTAATPPISKLADRGLLFATTLRSMDAEGLQVPRAVVARLRPLDYLLVGPAKVEAPAERIAAQPAIDELILATAGALAEGGIQTTEAIYRQRGFQGWETVPVGKQSQVNPLHPRLDAKGRALLARRSGLSPAAAEFVVEMMLVLGIVEGKGQLTLRPDRLQGYFQRSIAERWHMLGMAWQALDEWSEMLLICDTDGPFALSARGPFPRYVLPLIVEALAFRGILTRLLARLSPDRWHNLDDLLALIRQLADDVDAMPFDLASSEAVLPLLSTASMTIYGTGETSEWWLAERDKPNVRLDLASPEVLDRYYRVLLHALLTGPFAWLGAVEVTERSPADLTFRVRPGANALLVGDALRKELLPVEAVSEILVDDDLSIRVPSRTTDPEVYRLLGETSELTGAAREGLGYRLTAERVQRLFDGGMTGPELVAFLARHAQHFPRAARARLEDWWSNYGTVQLYDDLTLIELGDDYLLPELLATSALEKVLVHTFSPRLIAVETSAVDGLRAELERLGHLPKLVEGE